MYTSGTLGCPILLRPAVTGPSWWRRLLGLTPSCTFPPVILLLLLSRSIIFFLLVPVFGVIGCCVEETYFNLHLHLALTPLLHSLPVLHYCFVQSKIVVYVFTRLSRPSSLYYSWLSVLSLSGVNTEQILPKSVLASLSLVSVCSKGIIPWLTLLSVFLPA